MLGTNVPFPSWGPYSKDYAGISHLPRLESGVRFDLSLFPGYYRGRIDVPNVKWESGWHPWEASADLRYYSVRYELEWKDRVFIDAAYFPMVEGDDTTRLIRCECVNNTDAPQSLAIQLFGALRFPEVEPGRDEVLHRTTLRVPEKRVVINAVDYAEFSHASPRPTDNLMPDGLKRGEIRAQGFLHGRGIRLGPSPGDSATFHVEVETEFHDAVLLLRMRSESGRVRVTLSGGRDLRVSNEVEIASPALAMHRVPVGAMKAGSYGVTITGTSTTAVDVDTVCLVEAAEAEQVIVEESKQVDVPAIEERDSVLSLRYPEYSYAVAWDFEPTIVREFVTDNLDSLVRRAVHDHVLSVITDRWGGETGGTHYSNVFLRPILVAPQSTRVVWALVAADDPRSMTPWDIGAQFRNMSEAAREDRYRAARSKRVTRTPGTYQFSQDRMAAVTLSNVVYPVDRCGTPIVHATPGRWWNSLYTWDSGFVGLGLRELDEGRAIDCLDTYLTDPDDEHRAFIHHGTPVPVQIYLFQEIWNRRPSRGLLEAMYPKLKRFHAFLAGRLGSSTTNRFSSDLLATWDYFYNSGGWDDYPPQVAVHRGGRTGSVTPVCTTAHAIRTARILSAAAAELGHAADVREYQNDIDRFSSALQTHAYDPASGYFSYVVHDQNGRPAGPLNHETGANYNMGLDGAYPLVSGICTDDQEDRLIGYLGDSSRLWTDIGLSTVDQSAPYYRIDGYWNGAVWFPHQWFFWKTCLDLGRLDLARRIASTGLEIFHTEVERSYNCYEHFIIETKRGAGWHQFSGLSTPVLLWYGAYFEPGRLTFGFDVWVHQIETTEAPRRVRLSTQGRAGRQVWGLYCTGPGAGKDLPDIRWNDVPVEVLSDSDQTVAFSLPAAETGTLEIR